MVVLDIRLSVYILNDYDITRNLPGSAFASKVTPAGSKIGASIYAR